MPTPVITSPLLAPGIIGFPFSYQIVADNAPTSFAATGLPAGLTINTATGLISGHAVSSGVTMGTMSATNASGTDTQPLTISISSGTKPVITNALIAHAIDGVPFSFDLTATQNAVWTAPQLPSWLSLVQSMVTPGTATISGTPPALLKKNEVFKILATNSTGTATSMMTIPVSLDVNYPVFTSPDTFSIITGAPADIQLAATNSPSDWNLDFALPAGLHLNRTTGRITGTPLLAQTWFHQAIATNDSGSDFQRLTIFVSDGATNLPPVITSLSDVTATNGQPFVYQITATNDPTSYAIGGNLPPGLILNLVTGRITGVPTSNGTYPINQKATNDSGTGAAVVHITVAAAPAIPVINSPAEAAGEEGQSFFYFITATNSPTSFNATGLPPGLNVNTVAGTISGTLQASGIFNIGLSATNGAGTGTGVLVLMAGTSASKPMITSPSSIIGTTGEPLNYQITADNDPSSFEALGLEDTGLTLDPVTGAISGVLGPVGVYVVKLRAYNGYGRGDLDLEISSIDVGIPVTPVITSPLTAEGVVTFGFEYQITATNFPKLYSAENLPAGLTLNPTTGLISGAPAVVGSYDVVLGATNDFGTGLLTITLDIQDLEAGSGIISPSVSDPEGSPPERLELSTLTCVCKLRYVEKRPDEQLTVANLEAYRLMITCILNEEKGDWAGAAQAEAKAKERLDKELNEYIAGVKHTIPMTDDSTWSMSDSGDPL